LVWPALPCTPATEEIVTTQPALRFIISNTAARQTWNVPPRLVSTTRFQSWPPIITSGLSASTPAEVTTVATGPSSRWVSVTHSPTASWLVTSTCAAATRTPCSAASLARSRAASACDR
jgi:hypothetical protein